MSLATIAGGCLPVVLVFLAVAWLAAGRRLNGPAALVTTAEAVVVTLLAALWFGTLGAGGWPAVFLLLGLLVGGAERGLRFAFLRSGGTAELRGLAWAVARYFAAGALLAWRLG